MSFVSLKLNFNSTFFAFKYNKFEQSEQTDELEQQKTSKTRRFAQKRVFYSNHLRLFACDYNTVITLPQP